MKHRTNWEDNDIAATYGQVSQVSSIRPCMLVLLFRPEKQQMRCLRRHEHRTNLSDRTFVMDLRELGEQHNVKHWQAMKCE